MGGGDMPIAAAANGYQRVIESICQLDWQSLDREQLVDTAWAYYHFSVQFREAVEIARALFPADPQLELLERGECDTDNLSPWPGVAGAGERMNHDEFMRRTLTLSPINDVRRQRLTAIGEKYLSLVRGFDRRSRALSLSTYENGGLAAVFRTILRAEDWNDVALRAFQHFLSEHIRLDTAPETGHGALCQHLEPDEQVLSLWRAFRELLVAAVPRLAR